MDPVTLLVLGGAYVVKSIIEHVSASSHSFCALQCKPNAFGEDGLGTRFTFSIEPAEIPEGAVLLVWLKTDDKYLKAQLDDFKDEEGNLVFGRRITHPVDRDHEGRAAITTFLPYVALGAAFKGAVELVAKLRGGDGEELAESSFSDEIDSKMYDRQNIASALCDGAIGVVRADGDVKRSHVSFIRGELQNEFRLDPPGLRTIRDYIRRAVVDPEIATYGMAYFVGTILQQELEGRNRIQALEFILGVAHAGGGVSTKSLDFARLLGAAMNLETQTVDAAVNPFLLRTNIYLDLLGLDPMPDREAILRAWRKNLKQWHPDRFHGAGDTERLAALERTRLINEAKEALLRAL